MRIEDDIFIHEDHAELLTQVPRTIEEIENFMKVNNENLP